MRGAVAGSCSGRLIELVDVDYPVPSGTGGYYVVSMCEAGTMTFCATKTYTQSQHRYGCFDSRWEGANFCTVR